jgi:hypothetical protein
VAKQVGINGQVSEIGGVFIAIFFLSHFFISPLDVMVNGSQAQHGITRSLSVFYGNDSVGSNSDFSVSSLDALIVSPTRSPFPAVKPLQPSDLDGGMSFNLFNNVWNTNFPLFYPYRDTERDQSLLFRFRFLYDRALARPSRNIRN